MFKLKNGVRLPKIGFGTWQSKAGSEAYNAVKWAIEAGYTLIDTAFNYENEESVGAAIADSGIDRSRLIVTTKLPAEVKTYEGTIEYFEKSMEKLGLDYIDLYLIHAPWRWDDVGGDYTRGNIAAWQAILDLQKKGKIISAGVSNFHPKDIEAIAQATGVMPQVNQIRFFIGNTQENITEYCQRNNILLEAYSPLGTGRLLQNELVFSLAKKYNTVPSEICIAYCLQRGTLPIVKSVTRERIIRNLSVNTELSEEDISILNSAEIPQDMIRPFRS